MGKYIHIQISGEINKVTGLRYRLRIMFKINVRKDRIGNQEWTIQRNRQHCAHKTEDEDIANYKNTAQKPKKVSNQVTAKNRGNQVLAKGT